MRRIRTSFLVFAVISIIPLAVWLIVGRLDQPSAQGTDVKGSEPPTPARAREEIAKATKAETDDLANSCNQFALDVYHHVAAKQAKEPANCVVAPYSIAESLGLMSLGARGDTAAEIAKTLHLKVKPERLAPVFASLGIGSGGHLTEKPAVVRRRFGARVQDVPGGVEVVEVKPSSPAEQAGLKPKDRIVRLGDTPIQNTIDYANAMDNFTDFIQGETQTGRSFGVRLAAPPVAAPRLRPLIANALWGRKGVDFLPAFKDAAVVYYHAAVESMDFETDPAKARDRINQWVSDQTDDNIQNLLPKDSITPETVMVLTNTVFFYGNWKNRFNLKTTNDYFFTPEKGKKLKVCMMHKTELLRYWKGPTFKVLELPYEGDFAMTVFLPDYRDSLPKFEKNDFNLEKINSWIAQMREIPVAVSLPRFKIASDSDLKSALSALGMPTAFTKKADFTGITKQKEVGLSNVVHMAEVEVNEVSTKASSATASVFVPLGSPDTQFTANRPFMFVIRDTRTGVILFVGRVVSPTLCEK